MLELSIRNDLVELLSANFTNKELIKLIVELDDRIILGKQATAKGLEFFLHCLMQQGYTYDQQSMRILDCKSDEQELVNWGSLWPWAVLFAGEPQSNIPIFNMRPNKQVQEDIQIRVGVDYGKIKFFANTRRIVSDAVNYAAHLEKKGTEPGKIGISEKVFKQQDKSTASIFADGGTFEDRCCYITYRRFDDQFINKPLKETGKKKRA